MDGMLGDDGGKEIRGKTAGEVFYLDASKLDVNRRYFVFGNTVDPGEQKPYEFFYRPLLTGVSLDRDQLVELYDGLPYMVSSRFARPRVLNDRDRIAAVYPAC